MTTVAVLATLTVGYVLGRIRPWQRLDDWADWEVRVRGGAWAITRPRVWLLFAAHAVTQPRRTARAWRHRHDPPPPKSRPLPLRHVNGEEP